MVQEFNRMVQNFAKIKLPTKGFRATSRLLCFYYRYFQLNNKYVPNHVRVRHLENSITFTQPQALHSSMIKPKDLFTAVLNLQINLKTQQLHFNFTIENISLIEKITDVDCYILNNKITFLFGNR